MFDFLALLTYPFMLRALAVGMLLAPVLVLLGIPAHMRKMTFFADGIAHASLAGIAIALTAFILPLWGAAIAAVILALLVVTIERRTMVAVDTAIGMIFTAGLSVGVVVVSLQPGYQPELMSYLFGNILMVTQTDVFLTLFALTSTFVLVFFCGKNILLFSINEELAIISGVRTMVVHYGFAVVLALAVVLAMKVLGVLLVSALLIIPVAIAKATAVSLQSLTIWSILWSEIMVVGGIITSAIFNTPTGPTIVLLGIVLFTIVAVLHTTFKKAVKPAAPTKAREA